MAGQPYRIYARGTRENTRAEGRQSAPRIRTCRRVRLGTAASASRGGEARGASASSLFRLRPQVVDGVAQKRPSVSCPDSGGHRRLEQLFVFGCTQVVERAQRHALV